MITIFLITLSCLDLDLEDLYDFIDLSSYSHGKIKKIDRNYIQDSFPPFFTSFATDQPNDPQPETPDT